MITSRSPKVPRYQQIADELRAAIILGHVGIGQYLPSFDDMAGHFCVAVATIQRAVAVLVTEGYVVSLPGKGTRVVTTDHQSTEQAANRALDEMEQRLAAMHDGLTTLRGFLARIPGARPHRRQTP